MAQRQNRWFQPKDGISREVIQADIQRYLGRDATVRPGEDNGVTGYWITAYRTLTTEMVRDLQTDSRRWEAEVAQGRGRSRGRDSSHSSSPDKGLGNYTESATHRSRQYYGPTETPAPEAGSSYGAYAQPTYAQPATAYPADRDRRTTQPSASGYASTQQYGQEAAYTYTTQAQAYAQPTAYAAAPTQYTSAYSSYQQQPAAYGSTTGYPSTSASQPRTTYYATQDTTAQDPYPSARTTYAQPATQSGFSYPSTYATPGSTPSTTNPPTTSAPTYQQQQYTPTHPQYQAPRGSSGRHQNF